DVGGSLHEGKTVIDVAGGYQELVLTYFNHLARLQAQRDNLPDRVTRKGDVARTLGFTDKDLQSREETFRRASNRLKANLYPRVFPEKDMMFEVDRKLVSKHDVHDGHKFAINVDGHVANPEISYGLVKFGSWYRTAEWAVSVFLILVGWYI